MTTKDQWLRDDEFEQSGYLRTLEFERGALDMDTGEFNATLATDGEASDGHILSMKGAQIPKQMPLLLAHSSTGAVPALGSVLQPVKEEHRIRVRPRVNLNGDDILAGTRRGIAQLIADGDLNAMSVRWHGIKATRRVNLPSDHPAFVEADEETERRWGLFFDRWLGKEGSIVAVGADPKALIGRAQSEKSEGHHLEATFFTALARSAENSADSMANIGSAFLAISEACQELRDAGSDDATIVNAVRGIAGLDSADLILVSYSDGQKIFVPRDAWDEWRGEALEEYQRACEMYALAGVREKEPEKGNTTPAQTRDAAPVVPAAPAPNTVGSMEPTAFMANLGEILGREFKGVVGQLTGRK